MRKFQYLLFVLKQSYICYYIICMTVPLIETRRLLEEIRYGKPDYFSYIILYFQASSNRVKTAFKRLENPYSFIAGV